MKNIIKILSSFSKIDTYRLMIAAFWMYVMILYQMFYPPFGSTEENVFFALCVAVVASIPSIGLFDLALSIFVRSSASAFQNLPYELFYHYKLKNVDRAGCIYLVRRLTDGVYKIGKATDFDGRFKELRKEYGLISVVALWEVNDLAACERVALERTKGFAHWEESRKELRFMDDWQCWQFINDFTRYMIAVDTGVEKLKPSNGQMPLFWSQADNSNFPESPQS